MVFKLEFEISGLLSGAVYCNGLKSERKSQVKGDYVSPATALPSVRFNVHA